MLTNNITVSQLNTYVKSLIENDPRLAIINVSGEISNFKNHFASGHWYFTLKDKNASIRCVMFKGSNTRVKFSPTDGMAVILKGKVSLYEKDGQYQFYAEEMHPEGEGDLALAFKQVKEKLEREGLFDSDSKRPLVKFPNKIAVVTSDTGAAVKDILNITATRFPVCEIILCPVLVQGEQAAADMIKTLDRLYALDDIDTVIIGRGGGSAEDLHCFNDEALARKIYESPFPVISAVGHETDFTICDFVADVRASTPSHAAELAVPDSADLINSVLQLKMRIKNLTEAKHRLCCTRFDGVQNKVAFLKPERFFEKKHIELDALANKILNLLSKKLQTCEHRTEKAILKIDALSPLKIISRGFAAVTKDGNVVKTVADNHIGDSLKIHFTDGNIDCDITAINKKG